MKPDTADLNEGQATLYGYCVKLALAKREFPTIGQIERRLDFTTGALQGRMEALRRKGLITWRVLGYGRRIVEIEGLGIRTAEPCPKPEPAPRERANESPIRAMVRKTFAAYEKTARHRRADFAVSTRTMAAQAGATAIDSERPTGEPCMNCGVAGQCQCPSRRTMYV
jgi:hypothetical protein